MCEMRWSLGTGLRSAWRRLPNAWHVRGLVIALGLATLVSPVGVVLVLLTEKQRERACRAAGNDWGGEHCLRVYQDCEIAGARYPLGTTYTDGCNVCHCLRHGRRCTAKYCFGHAREQRVLEIGDGRAE
jgi:hypothetical protein